MGAEIRRAGAAIEGAQVKAPVAIMHSYDSRFAFQIQPNNAKFSYPGHCQHVYRAMYRRNIAGRYGGAGLRHLRLQAGGSAGPARRNAGIG